MKHESKDTGDGKYAVLFGSSPEPILTEEVHRLEFKLTLKADGSLVNGVKDAQVVWLKNRRELKTFAAPESSVYRKGKGWYDTEIFIPTQPEEYEGNISFSAEGKKYSLYFLEDVVDRSNIYVPVE